MSLKIRVINKNTKSLISGKKGQLFSFINPANLNLAISNPEYLKHINYFSDGWLLCFILRLFTTHKIERVSFDNTSIAKDVFSYCCENQKSVFIIGANQRELSLFLSKIKQRYDGIPIIGAHNGYFQNSEKHKIFSEIVGLSPDFLIVGLGGGLQETFLVEIKEFGYTGIAFTCGGFIRQEAGSGSSDYYPNWINRLNLRAIYRMYKEPHTINRYLIHYPKNIFRIIFFLLSNKLKLEIK